jgi:hypothetical protein
MAAQRRPWFPAFRARCRLPGKTANPDRQVVSKDGAQRRCAYHAAAISQAGATAQAVGTSLGLRHHWARGSRAL